MEISLAVGNADDPDIFGYHREDTIPDLEPVLGLLAACRQLLAQMALAEVGEATRPALLFEHAEQLAAWSDGQRRVQQQPVRLLVLQIAETGGLAVTSVIEHRGVLNREHDAMFSNAF